MNKEKNDKYIDPVKMGSFMAKCRKEKNLTQEDIAVEFGITSQSVSKWESGKNAPDITILMKLSEILGVEVHELLLGEKDTSSNRREKDTKINQTFVDGIKFYEEKSKKKYFKILIGCLTILIVLLMSILAIYSVNNYNKINIYKFCDDEKLLLEGKIIFNPERRTILINNVFYNDIYNDTDLEIKAKQVFVRLLNGDKILLEYKCPDNNGEMKSLNEFLEKVHIEVSSPLSGEEFKLIKDDLENLEFMITYTDSKDNNIDLKFPLEIMEEFSNNKIFYYFDF